ncbi:MAG TPA: hypothetical protein VFW73_01040, partial [Lacipirellulaceae bacterium]|nr:hypothetical protein [Lacipirellulaceae bacterium]
MINESLRRRLEALNRGSIPTPNSPIRGTGEAASAAAHAASRAGGPSIVRNAPSPAAYTPGLLRSGEVVETGSGAHIRLRLPLQTFWQNGPHLIAARQEFLRSHASMAQDAVEPALVMDSEFASFVA